MDRAEIVSADEFLTTIEEMTMIEKYYTPDQMETLRQRREDAGEAGEARSRRGPKSGRRLDADIKAATDAGLDPSDPKRRHWPAAGTPWSPRSPAATRGSSCRSTHVPERRHDPRHGREADEAGNGMDGEGGRGGRDHPPQTMSRLGPFGGGDKGQVPPPPRVVVIIRVVQAPAGAGSR